MKNGARFDFSRAWSPYSPSASPGAVLENAMMKKFFAAVRPCFAGAMSRYWQLK
jgi:hypothetical protein